MDQEYTFIVDGKTYKTKNRCVSGAYVRVVIPGFDYEYLMDLKNEDGGPDTFFREQDTVDLTLRVPVFYTYPRGVIGG